MTRPLFAGYTLDDPRLTRLLDAQIADNARVDASLEAEELERRQREMNEAIFVRAVDAWFRRTDAAVHS